MTVEQMQEAAKLGAFIELDFRNTLEHRTLAHGGLSRLRN